MGQPIRAPLFLDVQIVTWEANGAVVVLARVLVDRRYPPARVVAVRWGPMAADEGNRASQADS